MANFGIVANAHLDILEIFTIMIKRQSGRIKVFVIVDAKMDGVSWWRYAHPFAVLEKQYGDTLEIVRRNETVMIDELMSGDIVIRLRPMTKESADFLTVCKELGLKVILDIDDDLWHVPPSHPAFSDSLEYRETMRKIYSEADYVWASTQNILYSADALGRGEVIPNAILPSQLPEQPLPYKGIAAWRGNDKQSYDINSDFAKAWYRDWRNKYEHFVFAGYFPVLPHDVNARFVKGVNPLAYFLNLKNGMANVFWKPLEECPFNDAKSNIAWIEATMSGGVCVTNYANREEWKWALPDFTTDPNIIAEFWQGSKEHILQNYNLLKVNERRFKSIVKLVNA